MIKGRLSRHLLWLPSSTFMITCAIFIWRLYIVLEFCSSAKYKSFSVNSECRVIGCSLRVFFGISGDSNPPAINSQSPWVPNQYWFSIPRCLFVCFFVTEMSPRFSYIDLPYLGDSVIGFWGYVGDMANQQYVLSHKIFISTLVNVINYFVFQWSIMYFSGKIENRDECNYVSILYQCLKKG